MSTNRNSGEISFKLLDKMGLIAVTPRGWNKELNLVSWNGAEAKFDIRDWSPEHDKMSKGITLREEELRGLHNLLLDRYGKKKVSLETDTDVKDKNLVDDEEIECDENGEVVNS